MPDGCRTETPHGVTAADAGMRWEKIEAIIARTPKDDWDAQWSVVTYCGCCNSCAKYPAQMCSRCQEVTK